MGTELESTTQACILVIGGSDQIGDLVVFELLQSGFRVATMGLDSGTLPVDARSLRGEVRDGEALRLAMSEADAVVVVPGPDTDARVAEMIYVHGVEGVVADARGAGVQVVLVTQVHLKPPEASFELRQAWTWQNRAEQTVRASSLGYTIVHPARLTDEPGGRTGLRLAQGTDPEGSVSRADTARACAEVLLSTSALCTTFELYKADGPPMRDWERAFSALLPDKSRH